MMKHALARMFHELPAATADMGVLPGVLGCSFDSAQDKLTLRRTVQGTLRVQHPAVDRWHAYLHGLATLIHETSGLVLVVFVILFTAVTTSATEPEPMSTKNGAAWLHAIRAGVLKHDVDDLWSGTRKEGGVDLNAEIIFSRPSFSLLSGNVRLNLGASINTQGDTSKLYGGILWELAMKSGIFLNLGIGAAVHNGELDTSLEDKKSLGSRVLLRIPIEIGYSLSEHHQISILFDHVSNAFLVDPNEGLDTLGLRYGYRF